MSGDTSIIVVSIAQIYDLFKQTASMARYFLGFSRVHVYGRMRTGSTEMYTPDSRPEFLLTCERNVNPKKKKEIIPEPG
jgi:hypothetical protein